MLVGFPPGGGADVAARIITPNLSENLGHQVVIDNRAGATGTIAAGLLAKAPADGYTVMMGHMATLTIVPHVYAKLPYDPVNDFAPVTMAGAFPHMMSVHPSLPVTTVKQFIALAKSQPGKLNYASSGQGTPYHMAGELFKSMAGIDVVHVPYRNSGEARSGVIGGQVQMMIDAVTTMAPNVAAGQVRALATTGKTRSGVLPDVQTAGEAGVPGYEATIWLGLMAPAGTPKPVIDKLNAAVNEVVKRPEIVKLWSDQGAVAMSMTPEAFDKYLRGDIVKWAEVVKQFPDKPQ